MTNRAPRSRATTHATCSIGKPGGFCMSSRFGLGIRISAAPSRIVARNPSTNAISPYISFERPTRQRNRGS